MSDIRQVIERLVDSYSVPEPPAVADTSDPFQYILWENVIYLVDDDHRKRAYDNLCEVVGPSPAHILAASPEQFSSVIALGGADKKGRVKKLIDSARNATDKFDGDVKRLISLPHRKAVTALKGFPSIGEPGAEKILLFCGASTEVLPLESNGLRVLTRIGFAEDDANYSAMYRNVRRVIGDDIAHDIEWLTTAHLLLRKHGQIICRRVDPMCGRCVVLGLCQYGRREVECERAK